jgi:hypothetical protein
MSLSETGGPNTPVGTASWTMGTDNLKLGERESIATVKYSRVTYSTDRYTAEIYGKRIDFLVIPAK